MRPQDDPVFVDFLNSRNITEGTRISYQMHINKFCDITNVTPTQLIQQAEEDEESGIKSREKRIRKYLLKWYEYAKTHDVSANYTRGVATTTRVFLKDYDIEIPNINYKLRQEHRTNINDIPTIDDIRLAMEMTNLKYRAIILTMISSGMGRSEVLGLTYKDYINALSEPLKVPLNTWVDIGEIKHLLDKNTDIIANWHIQRSKTKKWYDTFTTHEATHKIAEYLTAHKPENLDTKIFRTKYTKKGKIQYQPISPRGFINYFYLLNKKCNFGNVGRQSKFRSHNLRKYFVNAMLSSGASKLAIDWMIGHEIHDGSAAPYYLNNNTQFLLTEYKKGIEKITIEKVKVERADADSYIELMERMKSLENKVAERDSVIKVLMANDEDTRQEMLKKE